MDLLAVEVEIVRDTGKTAVRANNEAWMGAVAKINDLLRFFLVIVALGVVMYWGYLLISAKGDESKLQKANLLLTFGGIWILVAVFAWLIVKLVVNFAGG